MKIIDVLRMPVYTFLSNGSMKILYFFLNHNA